MSLSPETQHPTEMEVDVWFVGCEYCVATGEARIEHLPETAISSNPLRVRRSPRIVYSAANPSRRSTITQSRHTPSSLPWRW